MLTLDGIEVEAETAGYITLPLGPAGTRLLVMRMPVPGTEETELQVYFRDQTNDRGTYPAGRFVELTRSPRRQAIGSTSIGRAIPSARTARCIPAPSRGPATPFPPLSKRARSTCRPNPGASLTVLHRTAGGRAPLRLGPARRPVARRAGPCRRPAPLLDRGGQRVCAAHRPALQRRLLPALLRRAHGRGHRGLRARRLRRHDPRGPAGRLPGRRLLERRQPGPPDHSVPGLPGAVARRAGQRPSCWASGTPGSARRGGGRRESWSSAIRPRG